MIEKAIELPYLKIRTEHDVQWRFFLGELPELVSYMCDARKNNAAGTIAVCNVHMFVEADRDPMLASAINSTGFALCDGQPIAWLASITSGRKVSRITGPDLFSHILQNELRNLRVALVGGNETLLAKIRSKLSTEHGANLLTINPGYVTANGVPRHDIIDTLKLFDPDITFVGLGCPKQEKWMTQAAAAGVRGLHVGVGAAFEYFSGDIKRAPVILRRLGLEWLYRLVQQPRLLNRYGRTNPAFLLWLIKFTIRQKWFGHGVS